MASAIVTCVTWVRKGVAKAVPDKVELSKDELKALIEEGQRSLEELTVEDVGEDDEDAGAAAETMETRGDDDDDEDEDRREEEEEEEEDAAGDDDLAEYKLDDYDDEPEVPDAVGSGFHNFAVYASNDDDPYITLKDDREDEDDREDTTIKPTDNMIIIGKAEEDFTNLEIYVHNEEEGSLYVHHDILLPAFPLALEWMNFDPTEQQPGNLVAVGNMTPVIDVWDLDIINTVEPAFTLGKKKKKKSKKKPLLASEEGHVDAVLDLSWNRHIRHGLASASADHSVLLWDLTQCKALSVLRQHTDKVQTVEWHPFEFQSLLSGGFDGMVNVYDCQSPEDNLKTWTVDGEVERVLWNHFQPFNFLASTDKGHVYSMDIRTDKPVFTLHAHEEAVTGLTLSPTIPDCLVTCSADNSYKIWDIQDNKPALIVSKDPKMGVINSAVFCPDSPFLVAMGGERDSLRLMDLTQHAPVARRFGGRQQDPVIPHPSEMQDESGSSSQTQASGDAVAMATTASDTIETGSEASSSAASSTSGQTRRKKKKKKKKNLQPATGL